MALRLELIALHTALHTLYYILSHIWHAMTFIPRGKFIPCLRQPRMKLLQL